MPEVAVIPGFGCPLPETGRIEAIWVEICLARPCADRENWVFPLQQSEFGDGGNVDVILQTLYGPVLDARCVNLEPWGDPEVEAIYGIPMGEPSTTVYVPEPTVLHGFSVGLLLVALLVVARRRFQWGSSTI